MMYGSGIIIIIVYILLCVIDSVSVLSRPALCFVCMCVRLV
jgi:hypothetical protein